MATDIGDAYVRIIPKAPGISNQIEGLIGDGAEDAGSSAGSKIGSGMLGTLGKVVSVAAVGKIVKDAFSAGGDLQQSFGGLETIYGDAAAQAKEFAVQAASAGISANSYAEQAVSFGAALKQAYGGDTEAAMNAANIAIMDMADNSAKMGTDINSVQAAYQGFAKQNYTMLDNLKLGYGGTKTEMERLLADASELSGVEYNIDNLGDVYEAIHVIQEDLGLTGVAAAEAQTTMTGSFGALQASWTNLLAAMTTGEGLDAAMTNFSNSVGNFANNVLTMLGNLAPQLPALIGGLADTIIANAPEFIASGIELMVQLAVGLLEGIPDLIAKVPEIFSRVKSAFAGVNWGQLGLDIIKGIVNGLWNGASNLWNAMTNIVKGALKRGQKAAETGSPSRLFENELGRWIPEGIAVGIEDNANSVNSAISDVIKDAAGGMNMAMAQGPVMPQSTSAETNRLIDALQNLDLQTNVVLDGDARKFLRVLASTNNARTKATNYNALAAAGA